MTRVRCDAPIAQHPDDRKRSIVVPSADLIAASPRAGFSKLQRAQTTHLSSRGLPAKESLTYFDVLARGEHASACRVRPVTGRMHQIRVHAELLGFPLAGDTQYGVERQPTGEHACARLLLHAHSLRVMHPSRGEAVRFLAPPPKEFAESARALGVPVDALEQLQSEAGAVWLGEEEK